MRVVYSLMRSVSIRTTFVMNYATTTLAQTCDMCDLTTKLEKSGGKRIEILPPSWPTGQGAGQHHQSRMACRAPQSGNQVTNRSIICA